MRRWMHALPLAFGLMATLTSAASAAELNLPPVYFLAPIGAVAALVFAFVFYRSVMKHDEGTDDMQRIARAVRQGAYAYLGRQARVVYLVVADPRAGAGGHGDAGPAGGPHLARAWLSPRCCRGCAGSSA